MRFELGGSTAGTVAMQEPFGYRERVEASGVQQQPASHVHI